MSHRNYLHSKSFWLLLLLLPAFFPFPVYAVDLYFSGVAVTGGADYVIKGNIPADKRYTGAIVCQLSSTDPISAPKTAILTTTLRRDTASVSSDQHTFSATDWTYNSASRLFYILLQTGTFPNQVDYAFDMPLPGPGPSELRTGTYDLSLYVTAGVAEASTKNNTVVSASFDYTVYSGRLIYDGGNRNISSLTPGSSDMCTADTYLSSVSGDWDAAWWDAHFALSGLCASSSGNFDGYSTDLKVIKDVSLATAPVLQGNTWSIKGQSPPDLTLSNMRLECRGSPPKDITLDSSLQSSVIEPGHEIAHFSRVVTPVWLEDTLNKLYYFQVGDISCPLPDDGPAIDDLQTGSHAFVSTITALGDTTSTNNQATKSFTYTVYSGLLYFNNVETTFSNLSFGSSLTCWDGSGLHLKLLSVNGSWSDIFGTLPFNGGNLCADSQNNPDGYSRDLQIFSGEVDMGTISTTVSGLDVDFYNTTLEENGGVYGSATVTLPDSITAHGLDSLGRVNPRGESTIDFIGATFLQSMEDVTLSAFVSYLHGYGLPFYIESSAIRLPLNGSTGMSLYMPYPVYVHEEAVTAMAASDPRTSFPSNDIAFHKPVTTASNSVSFDQNGFDGFLYFDGDSGNALQTSFPKVGLGFNYMLVALVDGQISGGALIEPTLSMEFGRGCQGSECADSSAGSRWYQVSSAAAQLTPEGAFGSQFDEIGPTLDSGLLDTTEDSVEWGDFGDTGSGTFLRQDRNRNGAFVIPGFIMPQTSDDLVSPYRLGQILHGSYSFDATNTLGDFFPLHDPIQPQATQGDGMFAGLNLGPETYTTLTEGVGQFLENQTLVRFFDVDVVNPQIPMDDRQAVKYVLRPGGLTGVFNTSFNSATDGMVSIYDYNLAFDRFAFRQDRNRLDGNTFIDGSLTLVDGPVANGVGGNHKDFKVAFKNLDLTCDGNLGAGQVDTVPEPTWPACDDVGQHKGCQTLVYWEMPVLLTGMQFAAPSGAEQGCPTEDRRLNLHTWNQIDGLGRPLTMSGFYFPDGVLDNQSFYGTVQTWFDKPAVDDDGKPGFPMRLRDAYLNQVGQSLPSWSGFTVLAGLTDVPLFDDARLAGHFDNMNADDRQAYDLHLFKDETDNDLDFDGVPENYSGDTVETLRQHLTTEETAAPKPYFEYSWPTDGMVDLNYYAIYQRASATEVPRFQGLTKNADVLGVIQVSSVPDYITPKKTKFSFGISADVAALQDFQLDIANYTEDLDFFLHNVLGVDTGFSMEDILCYTPAGGSEICLHDMEEKMLALTGGDMSFTLGRAVDNVMQQGELGIYIPQAAEMLSRIHQASALVNGILVQPLQDIRTEISHSIQTDLAGQFANVYNNLAPVAIYDTQALIDLPDDPGEAVINEMKAQLDFYISQLNLVIMHLENGILTLEGGVDLLVEPGIGVIDQLDNASTDALQALAELEERIVSQLSSVLLSPEPSLNPLLEEVDKARLVVVDVRNAIEEVDLGELGMFLQLAAELSGAAIDTSLLDDAEQTVNSSLDEIDAAIEQANQVIHDTYTALTVGPPGPLSTMIELTAQLVGESSAIQTNIVALQASLSGVKARLNNDKERVKRQFEGLRNTLIAFQEKIMSPTSDLGPITSWNGTAEIPGVVATAQAVLDDAARGWATVLKSAGGSLAATAPDPFSTDFLTLFHDVNFAALIDITFAEMLDQIGTGGLPDIMAELDLVVSSSLPQPNAEDFRNMLRTSIIESDAVNALNETFYAEFGLLSDQLDTVTTQLTGRINGLIRQTVEAVNETLSLQLSASLNDIGGWGTTLQSVGIDGYALVSQDEFERIHMDAEFVFDAVPDSTSYNAALDVTALMPDNGLTGMSGCGAGSGNYYDVSISTHDVSAEMLGMDVGIKTAMLGFTIDESAMPVGLYGNCYLDGEIAYDPLALEDLGLEAGVGRFEAYFGATGAGHFDDYSIPKAAFYLGKSCEAAGLGVVQRLDPEVGNFIGDISPLNGAYVRGSADIPVWNNGCAFTIGMGADVGAWCFTEPSPIGTIGALVGGSAYGRLACLASLKGKIECMGQLSGSEYTFSGSGWAGAGVGDCSPGSWHSVRDVRRDRWCETGDATFGASYDNGWDIFDLDINCCD
ncbi:MAG: hypothetical protein KQH63_12255 [Desulfobulbaceae bacterium]|nr:hypothetical protein [Desulfobulbaceae bacterium]